MNQLEKTSEETSIGDAGPSRCLRGLLHHSIGNPSDWRCGSTWADLMAGRELETRYGATGIDGDRVVRRGGMGGDSVDTPQL